jgi:hypothetical protein
VERADPRVVRPVDLRARYANPAKELRRLARRGALLRLGHGYYAVIPEEYRGTAWRPSAESAGLAIGQADYGTDHVAVMGVSAARLLGAVPRALGVAVIAVSVQRPPLETTAGCIRFVTRRVRDLDVCRVDTDLAAGWATTPEQTVLDLADRPALGHLSPREIAQCIRRLAADVDWEALAALARAQRKRPAAVRAAAAAGIEAPVKVSRPVPMRGLTGD